jgi:hypothetical protein
VVKHEEGGSRQGGQAVGAALAVAEFDFERVVIELLDHGSDLSAHEIVLRHVDEQRDDIER